MSHDSTPALRRASVDVGPVWLEVALPGQGDIVPSDRACYGSSDDRASPPLRTEPRVRDLWRASPARTACTHVPGHSPARWARSQYSIQSALNILRAQPRPASRGPGTGSARPRSTSRSRSDRQPARCSPRSRVVAIEPLLGRVPWGAADLEESLANGDETLTGLLKVFDEYIRKTGIDAPQEPPRDPELSPPIPSGGIRELDLRGAGIGAVIWATGFRSDFRWIDLPIFDERGEPAHRRGITAIPGLSFLGLQWLYKRKSSFLYGLEEDATHLAEHIAARA